MSEPTAEGLFSGPIYESFKHFMENADSGEDGATTFRLFLFMYIDSLEARIRELEKEAWDRRTYELEQRDRE